MQGEKLNDVQVAEIAAEFQCFEVAKSDVLFAYRSLKESQSWVRKKERIMKLAVITLMLAVGDILMICGGSQSIRFQGNIIVTNSSFTGVCGLSRKISAQMPQLS